MTIFERIKCKSIDEFAEWLDQHGAMDGSDWNNWFDENYCNKCDAVAKDGKEYAWCELNGKCKYFQEMSDIPSNKQVIKMWLERDDEYEA